MQSLTSLLLDGLVFSAYLFIVSAGLTITFGVLRILNVAHGSLFAIGAYSAAASVGAAGGVVAGLWPAMLALMILSSCATAVALGLLLERAVFRRLTGMDEVTAALASFGLLLAFEDLIPMVFGVKPILLAQPLAALGTVSIAGVVRDVYSLVLVGAAVAIGAALWVVLHRTRAGAIVAAVVHDREMASALGVRVRHVLKVVFVVGAVLGCLGGALVAPLIAVAPGIGVQVIVMSFAVIVIGGLGSIPGAIAGSLVIGLCRALAVYHAPFAELFVVYLVMAAALVLKPEGLFAPRAARRI